MEKKDIEEIINEIKELYADPENTTDFKVKRDLITDYNDIIELRNKLEYDVESDKIYEEDIISLDHVLDFMEIMFKRLINESELKKIKEELKD